MMNLGNEHNGSNIDFIKNPTKAVKVRPSNGSRENENIDDVDESMEYDENIDDDVNDDHIPKGTSSYLTMYGEHRAAQSFVSLPGWLQDYVEWSREQTRDKSKAKYLVLMCLPDDNSCGGLSDRFRGLFFYLFAGKLTDRVLCIYWTRPFPLETFLETTQSGYDWRCPEDLSELVDQTVPTGRQKKFRVYYWHDCEKTHLHDAEPLVPCTQRCLENIRNSTDKYAVTRLIGNTIVGINDLNLFAQSHSYVEYMPIINQWQYPDIIADVFRVMFKPVELLAKHVNATMTKLGLVENEYVSTHVRIRYPVPRFASKRKERVAMDQNGVLLFEGEHKGYLIGLMQNAVNCGHLLAPDLPMYFASDHLDATKYAVSTGITVDGGKVIQPVGLEHDKMPVHVGVREFQNFHMDDFFPVFEDLLIMGGSRCVSHGIGSFGSFGAGLAGNRCRAVHRKFNGAPEPCPNTRGDRKKMKIADFERLLEEEPGGVWDRKKIHCNISEVI